MCICDGKKRFTVLFLGGAPTVQSSQNFDSFSNARTLASTIQVFPTTLWASASSATTAATATPVVAMPAKKSTQSWSPSRRLEAFQRLPTGPYWCSSQTGPSVVCHRPPRPCRTSKSSSPQWRRLELRWAWTARLRRPSRRWSWSPAGRTEQLTGRNHLTNMSFIF